PNAWNVVRNLVPQHALNQCNGVPELALRVTCIAAVFIPGRDIPDERPQKIEGCPEGFLRALGGNPPSTFTSERRCWSEAPTLGVGAVHYDTRGIGITLRPPPSTRVRTWSLHNASAARTSFV